MNGLILKRRCQLLLIYILIAVYLIIFAFDFWLKMKYYQPNSIYGHFVSQVFISSSGYLFIVISYLYYFYSCHILVIIFTLYKTIVYYKYFL